MNGKNRPFNPLNSMLPMIGNQAELEKRKQMEILQQINALSLSIYSKMAGDHIVSLGHGNIDLERLKTMAKNSRLAAQAYFEGIGVIEPTQ